MHCPWFGLFRRANVVPLRGGFCRLPSTAQIRWKARWISIQEYSKAIGRPWGQLVGCSVFASSNNSHSIRIGSSRVLTLIAAWQAMDAAIARTQRFKILILLNLLPFCASTVRSLPSAFAQAPTHPGRLVPALTARVCGPKGSTSNPLCSSSSAIWANTTICDGLSSTSRGINSR